MDDASAIQSVWVMRKVAAVRRAVGWKIGLTSKAMQSARNIDVPNAGVLPHGDSLNCYNKNPRLGIKCKSF